MATDDQREPNGRKARNTGRPPGRPPRLWTEAEYNRVAECFRVGATMRSISKAMGILSEAIIAASTYPTHDPAQVAMQTAYKMYRQNLTNKQQSIDAALAALRECVGQVQS